MQKAGERCILQLSGKDVGRRMTAQVFLLGTGIDQREIAGMQTGLDILQLGTAVFHAGICLIQAVLIVWILTKLYGRRHDGIRGMAGSAVAAALLFIFWGVEQSGSVAIVSVGFQTDPAVVL